MRQQRGKRVRGNLRVMGWVFKLVVVLLLLSAWNSGINLLYIVLGGIVSFIALSAVLARWTMRGLVLNREAPAAVHRGEPFLVETRIENHKLLMPSISVRVESVAPPDSVLPPAAPSQGHVMKIPARRAAVLSVPLRFDKRGVYRLPPFDLASDFPFGLLEQRRRFEDPIEVVVYPRVQALRATALDRMPGSRAAARAPTGDGTEFFALREYMPGDEIRRIAWRISARLGVWMVREMTLDNARFVIFALDTRRVRDRDDFEERFEEVIELVASLAVTLLKRQYSVAVVTPAASVERGEGAAQERKVLEMLARLAPVSLEEYPDFQHVLRQLELEPARLVCVSPDPRLWGRPSGVHDLRVLDPREVIHA